MNTETQIELEAKIAALEIKVDALEQQVLNMLAAFEKVEKMRTRTILALTPDPD